MVLDGRRLGTYHVEGLQRTSRIAAAADGLIDSIRWCE